MSRLSQPESQPPEQAPGSVHLSLALLDMLVGYHLRRASAVFAADFNRAVAGTGMRQVLFAVLAMVADHPEANQGTIGRALGIQRANMVALIGELLERDLIKRVVSSDDRRTFSLRLTAAGESMVARCKGMIEAHEASLLAGFDRNQRTQLIALLARIEAQES